MNTAVLMGVATGVLGGFLGLLAIVGIHRLILVAVYLQSGRGSPESVDPLPAWPRITLQLPLFNERYVVEHLLTGVAALDYPEDRLEIQILDDSDDETSRLVAARIPDLQRRGLSVYHRRRQARTGFKAGALGEAMEEARGELFVVLDADFSPRPDFLKRLVEARHRAGEGRGGPVGMVQARWEHVNRDHSWLTRLQALFLDGHFLIEHQARQAMGAFFNFNGSAGMLEGRMIEAVGGWQGDTLTEDLDLSYRCQMEGYRFRYENDLTCPAQLPYRLGEFKAQQFRWVKGSIQTARKLLGPLLSSSLPLTVRLEGGLHLLTNLVYPLLLASQVIWVALIVSGIEVDLGWVGPLGTAGLVSMGIFYTVAHLGAGQTPWRLIYLIPFSLAATAGLAVNNSRAVLEGLGGSTGVFGRTPKVGPGANAPPDYRVEVSLRPVLEVLLGLWLALGSVESFTSDQEARGVLLGLFAMGALVSGILERSEGAPESPERGVLMRWVAPTDGS